MQSAPALMRLVGFRLPQCSQYVCRPLVVFLGGLLGPRRILLWASAVFMLAEFLSPFIAHNVGALIILQFIAGIAAGTYYPLTMTVIVRNLPLKYVHWGVAAYALDILASTHIATALEAWYINCLSWQWIFWNALIVTPLMMACLYWEFRDSRCLKEVQKQIYGDFCWPVPWSYTRLLWT